MRQTVFAQTDPEMDISSLLNDMRLKHKDLWDRSTMVDKVVDGRHLFDSSYAHELYKMYERDFQTLDLIYEHLTTHESYCPDWDLLNTDDQPYLTYNPETNKTEFATLTKKDVVNIFSETSYGVQLLWMLESQRLFDSSLSLSSDNSFAASCKRVIWCRDGLKQLSRDNTQTWFQDGSSDRDGCSDIVTDLYEWYSFQVQANLEYDNNRDREIYANGIVEQDRGQFCDINLKLENITKIVSSTAQDFPSFSSFDPQKVPNSEDDVRLPTEYVSSDEDSPDKSNFENINKYIPTRSVPDADKELLKNAEYLKDLWPAQLALSDGQTSRLVPKPKVWWVTTLLGTQKAATSDQVWWSSSALQNIQCEVNEFPAIDEAVDLYKEWTQLSALLNTYSNNLDTNERLRQAIAHPDNLTKREEEVHDIADEPLIDKSDLEALIADIDTLDTIEWDAALLVDEMKSSFGSCIQEFTDEDPESVWAQIKTHVSATSDIMECVRTVFCKEITDPSGRALFTIRYCSVPVRERNIVNTMRVDSISDTLDAQIAVLENMNNNGNMVRHVKTKEFREFQAFDLQYSPRFAFSLNTNIKKPKTTKDPKIQKQQAEQRLSDIRKVILQEYDDIYNQHQNVLWSDTYDAEYAQAANIDLQTGNDLSENYNQMLAIRESLTSVAHPEVLRQQMNQINLELSRHWSLTLDEQTEFWLSVQSMFGNLQDVIIKKYESLSSNTKS